MTHNILNVTTLNGKDVIVGHTTLSLILGLNQGAQVPPNLKKLGVLFWVETAPRPEPGVIHSMRVKTGKTPKGFDKLIGLPAGTTEKWESQPADLGLQ